MELEIRRAEGFIAYYFGIFFSVSTSLLIGWYFKECAPESGAMFVLILINGFFVSLGIGIKLNDLKYASR
jgi:hypothetical protein